MVFEKAHKGAPTNRAGTPMASLLTYQGAFAKSFDASTGL
jgi:hypothetical protein